MKNRLIYIIGILSLALACNKEQQVHYEGPDYIMFSDTLYTLGVLDGEECFELPICATRTSDQPRNVGVEILVKESDAVHGRHFVLESSTVTIPAGELETKLRLRGIPGNIDSGRDLGFSLRLVMDEKYVWDTYGTDAKVVLRKCCPFDRESFVGYVVVSSTYAMSYLSSYNRLTRVVADPDNENGLIIKDFIYDGYDVKIVLDTEDRLNPLLSYEEQVFAGTDVAFGTKYGNGKIMMYQPSGYLSYYSTCENFFLVYMTLYVGGVGTVGTFANVCERISDAEAARIMREGF